MNCVCKTYLPSSSYNATWSSEHLLLSPCLKMLSSKTLAPLQLLLSTPPCPTWASFLCFPIALKEQCISKNFVNIKISIFNFFIHFAPPKRAIALCKQPCRLCHRTTFELPLIQTTVVKDKSTLMRSCGHLLPLWLMVHCLYAREDCPCVEQPMCLTGASEKGNFWGAVFSGFNSQNSKRLHTKYTWCMEREWRDLVGHVLKI